MQKKKLLIIAYYWPPAGGPGVQRWLKFVKYLPAFGVHPIVYVPKNAAYPLLDETLLEDLKGIDYTLLQTPINEPNQWLAKLFKKQSKTMSSGVIKPQSKQSLFEKFLLWARGNLFIPDSRITWVKPSVRFLENFLSENQVDAMVTTGPPHSIHLIGLALKQSTQLPWLADFRDPWTEINYHDQLYLSKFAQKRHQTLESNVLQLVDTLVTTSEATKKLLAKKTKKPIFTITNGYDEINQVTYKKDQIFSLSHIGSLLSNRNPEVLWEVLAEIIKENDAFKNAFQLNLIGKVSQEILETLNKFEVDSFCHVTAYVSHQEAIKLQKQAQVLLFIEENSLAGSYIIGGKLFEYLVADTPIIAIGPAHSDVQQILKETNTGAYFYYNEKERLKAHVLDLFTLFENNQLKQQPIGLQKYHRKALTQQLVNSIPWV
jgi:hypothetical protein